ncbi:MAG TPA: hypothetical protein VFX98_11805 [Longimicrobiaceae bacterium]|nr:hypothetical protein [Longimicrobiaceae bacterium]
MKRSLLACLAALAAAACTPGADDGPSFTTNDDPSSVIFLAQDADPNAWMDALFRGQIVRDEQGCLRLETGATAVWPAGYTLEARDDGLYVRDTQGGVVGRVGDQFHLGGGWVDSLEWVEHLSAEKRALAEARCPGQFFVAAP